MPDHRGIRYEIIPPSTPSGRWTWIVHLSEMETKRGQSWLNHSAQQNAKRTIETALREASQAAE